MKDQYLYDKGYIVNYNEGDSSLHRTPLGYLVSVNDIFHTIRDGESLLSISRKYYNTQKLWYVIADVNMGLIEDIFQLPVGTDIVIPNLDILESIYG